MKKSKKISKSIFIFTLFVNCFFITYSTNYYVDASVISSGDGLSWQTAWKHISNATQHSLLPGDVIWIKDGTYSEPIYIQTSGEEIISLTTGIYISGNRVYFPSTVDLSTINLALHQNQYYLYLFRSMISNNGVYNILSVNNIENYVTIDNLLLNEQGVIGDIYSLSASIGRPIIFKNASENPETNRVILDLSSTDYCSAGYIGKYLNNYDANPVNYVIVDGIDLTGSKHCGGWHIQSSNFNVIRNSKIYNMGTVSQSSAVGILINGNANRPAMYNLIINNEIFNTPHEGIYIGAGWHPQYNNHSHFNHLINNAIYTIGSSGNAKLENAIDIKEYNIGNVIERNTIGPFQLVSSWNGALDIVHNASYTLAYGNIFRNITKPSGSSYYYIIGINDNATNNYIYNNLIYNESLYTGNLFGMSIKSTNLSNSYVAHNTIYNLPRGLLLDDDSNNSIIIANNIIHCNTPLVNWTSGNLTLSHNLYSSNPSSYGSEPGRLVGNPHFNDISNFDFGLSDESILAIDASVSLNPPVLFDILRQERDTNPDRGAFEFQSLLTLPIQIIQFDVFLIFNNVHIKWATISEKNNDYYSVEKSSDGFSWKKIDHIKGAGNSNSLIEYNSIDIQPHSGTSYYRLKQTDFDGAYSYSEIKTVNNFETSMLLYPNPTMEEVIIESIESIVEVKLFNIFGLEMSNNLLIKHIVSNKTNCNMDFTKKVICLRNYSKGTYFLHIYTKDKVSVHKLIII